MITTLVAMGGLFGLFGKREATAPPKPVWPAAPGPAKAAKPLVVETAGTTRLPARIRQLGGIPWKVVEYGTPALHVKADGATVRGFSWRGSMEGVHVGSGPFTPKGMRQKHRPIRVTLDGLWCDDVGEDAVEIHPRARVTIRNARIRGNHLLLPTRDADVRGLDKLVQIDSADVVFEDCEFFNGVSAVRAKANSNITLRRCRFIDCSTCVSGDGMACPRPSNPYDNGQPGPCRITLIDCETWDCHLFARAYEGCEIRIVGGAFHGTRPAREDGGSIRFFRHLQPGEVPHLGKRGDS